jgi:hypothetical protein
MGSRLKRRAPIPAARSERARSLRSACEIGRARCARSWRRAGRPELGCRRQYRPGRCRPITAAVRGRDCCVPGRRAGLEA